MEHEAVTLESLSMAQAAKNSGGIVIVLHFIELGDRPDLNASALVAELDLAGWDAEALAAELRSPEPAGQGR